MKCWKLPRHDRASVNGAGEASPVVNGKDVEVACIKGGAAIKKYSVLNDKRRILTKDSDNNVAVYDVLKVIKEEDLGPIDFDEELKRRNKKVYIPNWFTVDLKTGVSFNFNFPFRFHDMEIITVAFVLACRCLQSFWGRMRWIVSLPGYRPRLAFQTMLTVDPI